MTSNEKVNPQPGGPYNRAAPEAVTLEHAGGVGQVTEKEPVNLEEANEDLKQGERLPSPEEVIDALGIPNWRDLEKKIVRRLDFTLMPCLWVLYFFNYMDRASIG